MDNDSLKSGTYIKVSIAFEHDEAEGMSSECLWARYLQDGLAKICNIPLMAPEISLGDTVLINEDYEVVEIRERAADTRIIRYQACEEDEDNLSLYTVIFNYFSENNIPAESMFPGMIALAVPLGERHLEKLCDECPVKIILYPIKD
tara:strand:+ start:463 stop:903 length:441 start_codon:yes stop_codon:yes gene_type:complete